LTKAQGVEISVFCGSFLSLDFRPEVSRKFTTSFPADIDIIDSRGVCQLAAEPLNRSEVRAGGQVD